MKQNNVLVAAIVCASVAIVGLSGCGGSSNSGGGGGGGTPPTITSFTGSPAIIEAGSSASLTAVFSGGTGVITPGNIAASSGTAVSVSPATTTMYTLTVTSSGGLVSSQTSTVTVDPLPTITSFSAGAATIEAGSSTSLTAVFSGGTGTITAPGGYSSPVTSGIAVSISPTTTTPYTLTVTPPVGTVNATMMTTVTVDPVPTITSFSANPNPITTSGGSSALTAVFAGGTGTITAPGGYSSPVTSGVAVNVSPTATTTYTLTVTPPVGTVNATQAVTVTVAPPPVITSFTVAPTAIEDGSSAQLTAVFSGGTGVVTPGNITMTSGTPVSVLPTSTTTYTLTVTPPVRSSHQTNHHSDRKPRACDHQLHRQPNDDCSGIELDADSSLQRRHRRDHAREHHCDQRHRCQRESHDDHHLYADRDAGAGKCNHSDGNSDSVGNLGDGKSDADNRGCD